MREIKYTPGPWTKEDGDFIYHLNENGHNSFDVSINRGCSCDECKKLPEVNIEAITDLIAAAPEMLEILERLVMYYDHGELFPEEKFKITEAKRVIDKAHGDTNA